LRPTASRERRTDVWPADPDPGSADSGSARAASRPRLAGAFRGTGPGGGKPTATAAAASARELYGPVVGALAIAYLAIGAALRVAVWLGPARDGGLSFFDLLASLAIGVANDALESVYLTLPMAALLLVLPQRFTRARPGRAVVGVAVYAALAAMIFIAVCEFFFFDEFESRFNLVAVDYLVYPTEVVGNIEESYPVPQLLAAIAVAAAVLWVPVWRRARRGLAAVPGWRPRLAAFGANALAAALVALAFSSQTLSTMENRTASELSMNGASTFFRAFRTQEIDYDQFYRTLPRARAFAIMRQYLGAMGGRLASSAPESIVRAFPANPAGLGKMNVVIVSEESLGAQFVGAYGNPNGWTPVFDELARNGLLFRNAFATGTRTVRGLEAMSASFPPIPSEAIVKRPGGEHVTTLGSVLAAHGYRTSFLYGGYGAFDNMNRYFGSNGYELSDRLDIPNPRFTNVWGVSDEDLFHHAVGFFDGVAASGSPFFSIIMTTSNHKPFTFPPGVPGVPESGGDHVTGAKYADYAIGRFVEEARTRPWFANTLFVVIADHDSRVYGAAEIPVEHYRIPALFYAPGKIAPAVSQKIFSNMDLAPTILGLLGLPYSAPFYGVNVLDPAVPDSRPVLFSHNHDVALYEADKLSVVGLQKEARSFTYADGKTAEAALDDGAIDLLTAYLQTAYVLFQERRY